jgi:hypothetical protein
VTTVKIQGKPRAAATGAIELRADYLYTTPGARVIGVVEFAHTERTEPAPDTEKDRTVTLAISALELATHEQAETLRKAMRALYLERTAEGTLDIDGEVELSKTWLHATQFDLPLRESVRLRAGIRIWMEKAYAAFRTHNASETELRHELQALADGLNALLTGTQEAGA